MKIGEILINVTGQDEEEIENAIDLYTKLKKEDAARVIYINFSYNLISAEMVSYMIYHNFCMQPYHISTDKTTLTFFKREEKK